MKEFQEFIDEIEDPDIKARVSEVLGWVSENYPELKREIKWNQPMFTHHGTFIMGFSYAKKHVAAAPEKKTIDLWREKFVERGFDLGKMFVCMPHNQPVPYDLLGEMIEFNIEDKKNVKTFWRK